MDHQAFAQLLGNYGEFIGAIAVVATLIYLSVQVRQSKDLLEKNEKIALSQVYQVRAAARREFHLAMVEDSVASMLEKINVKHGFLGSADLEKIDELDDKERIKLANLLQTALMIVDSNEYQRSLGLLVDELFPDRDHQAYVANSWQGLAEKLDVQLPPRVMINWDEIRNTE